MIPKIIHYCWFGRNPKTRLAKKCIRSWKKYCPDYEIIEWNEDNYDLRAAPVYVQQAYEAKKWAFVTDYIRLQVVYEYGGIYMDVDVELEKPLDSVLEHRAYFGFENGTTIATGLGFGAEKGTALLLELMADYLEIPFLLEDGSYDLTPCPHRNTGVFLRHGLKQDDSLQILEGDVLILPTIYLCPIDLVMKIRTRSPKTISVHWYDASWLPNRNQAKWETRIGLAIYYVKLGIKKVIGEKAYGVLKKLRGREDGIDAKN